MPDVTVIWAVVERVVEAVLKEVLVGVAVGASVVVPPIKVVKGPASDRVVVGSACSGARFVVDRTVCVLEDAVLT